MKIAINTRLLLPGKLEGIGWFTHETLQRITANHPEHEFHFIFDRAYHQDFLFSKNIIAHVIPPQARHPLLFYTWFEFSIPYLLKKIKADIFLSTDGWTSLSSDIPSLTVMHDLNFEHYPEHLPWLVRKYYRYYFPRFARKSTRIATVSEYSKSDIVSCYGINPENIDVVYNGIHNTFHPISDVEKERTRKLYADGCPYFIYVGSLQPRKNLANLFRAFDILRKKQKIKLLVVGSKKWWTPEIRTAYENLQYKEDIVFTGRLEPEALNDVLAASVALTYVSYFEGFGIPLIEAMQCETAVITSNKTSMPEIAGDAALFADPFSPDSIAECMQQILSDVNLRQQLIEKGKIRCQLYSWDKSAELLWNSLLKVLPHA